MQSRARVILSRKTVRLLANQEISTYSIDLYTKIINFLFKGGLLKAIATNINDKVEGKTVKNLFIYAIVSIFKQF
jgi:hypothetical protein